MRNIGNHRVLFFTACLVIGLMTLLSQSLKIEIANKKAGTEQAPESNKQMVVISPSAAVTVNFFTLNVNGLLELSPVFQSISKVPKVVPVFRKATATFHQTLFRFIISPNAP